MTQLTNCLHFGLLIPWMLTKLYLSIVLSFRSFMSSCQLIFIPSKDVVVSNWSVFPVLTCSYLLERYLQLQTRHNQEFISSHIWKDLIHQVIFQVWHWWVCCCDLGQKDSLSLPTLRANNVPLPSWTSRTLAIGSNNQSRWWRTTSCK